jgi:ATP-dependent DNA helicase RecG
LPDVKLSAEIGVVSADNVIETLAPLRRIGGEPTRIEAKRATGGLPKSVCEKLSALSNTDGGTVLLGVDEQSGFGLVWVFDRPGGRPFPG